MPNPDEARDQAWLRAHLADWERPGWLNGWDAAKRDDQQRTAQRLRRSVEAREKRLRDALRRYMLYVDEWGYEPHGALAQEFGPVEFEGSSQSTEAWIDRVLREPARAALSEQETPRLTNPNEAREQAWHGLVEKAANAIARVPVGVWKLDSSLNFEERDNNQRLDIERQAEAVLTALFHAPEREKYAALIEAARDVVETGICVWCAEPMTAPYVSTRGETCPIHDLDAALRALAGQSEEAENATV